MWNLNNSSSAGHGLEVINHNGSVTINRAKVDGNAGGGAIINNRLGTAGVTITNSSFNNNVSDTVEHVGGLTIATRGALNLTGITTYGNTGGEPGLFIQQSGTLIIKNSVSAGNGGPGIANTTAFDDPIANFTLQNVTASNNAVGIALTTKGNITLSGVHADGNGAYNAFFNTCQAAAGECTWLGSGKVTISNSSFNDGGEHPYSLYINARGAITLTNVSSSGATGAVFDPKGAELHTEYSQLVSPIKITNGWFDGNDDIGLDVYSKGVVTLSKVSTSGNSLVWRLD